LIVNLPDFVDADAPPPCGDPVPAHWIDPEVSWSEPLPPVIRVQLFRAIGGSPQCPLVPDTIDASTDLMEPSRIERIAAFWVCVWCVGAALLITAHLEGWL
jgi:hypothetical protein